MIILSAFILLISCGGKAHNEEKKVVSKSIDTINNPSVEIKKENIKNIDSSTKKVKEVIHLTDGNFDAEISSGLVLVDFWATWCRPCRMQAPILEEINKEMNGKIKIAKLDIDKNRITTDRFGVMSIPTMILFKNGKMVNKFIGYTEKDVLIDAINKTLK